jgi:hypothetical protein
MSILGRHKGGPYEGHGLQATGYAVGAALVAARQCPLSRLTPVQALVAARLRRHDVPQRATSPIAPGRMRLK